MSTIALAPTPTTRAPRTRYRVTGRDGSTIAPRATITDHWGEPAEFVRVVRAETCGLAPRIIVRHPDTGTTNNVYASLYGLTVQKEEP
ncbi:hypothetical protein ACFWGP_05485 [Agromyces sp. NPDC127015]|uniref:hypothetical protein n=1 Tax=Agromyces sp. NPDC127015 TaxID=3347108 RepID=UPI00365B9520